MLFRGDEEPLSSFWESRNGVWSKKSHQRGTLLLRDKVLNISSSPTKEQIRYEKVRKEARAKNENKALKNAEIKICTKRYPSFENRDARQLTTQSPLAFKEDHFCGTGSLGSRSHAKEREDDVLATHCSTSSVCGVRGPDVFVTPAIVTRAERAESSSNDGAPISDFERGSSQSGTVPFGNQGRSSEGNALVHITDVALTSSRNSPDECKNIFGNQVLVSEGSESIPETDMQSSCVESSLNNSIVASGNQEVLSEGEASLYVADMRSTSSELVNATVSSENLAVAPKGKSDSPPDTMDVRLAGSQISSEGAEVLSGLQENLFDSEPSLNETDTGRSGAQTSLKDVGFSPGNRELEGQPSADVADIRRLPGNQEVSVTKVGLDGSRTSPGVPRVLSWNHEHLLEGKPSRDAKDRGLLAEERLSEISSGDTTAVREGTIMEDSQHASQGAHISFRGQEQLLKDKADSSLDMTDTKIEDPHGLSEQVGVSSDSPKDSCEEPQGSAKDVLKIPSGVNRERSEVNLVDSPWKTADGKLGAPGNIVGPYSSRSHKGNSIGSRTSQTEGSLSSEGAIGSDSNTQAFPSDRNAQANCSVGCSDATRGPAMCQSKARQSERHGAGLTKNSCQDTEASGVKFSDDFKLAGSNHSECADEAETVGRLPPSLTENRSSKSKFDGGNSVSPADAASSNSDGCEAPHQCDYFKIVSPDTLKCVLRACEGSNGEEEAEVNELSCICLSGVHLRWDKGSWSIVHKPDVQEDEDTQSLEGKCFPLERDITAVFLEQQKKWIVRLPTQVDGRHDIGAGSTQESTAPLFMSEGTPTFHVPASPRSDEVIPVDAHKQLDCTSIDTEHKISCNNVPGDKKQLEPCEVVSQVEKGIRNAVRAVEQVTKVSHYALDSSKHQELERIVCQELSNTLAKLVLSGFCKHLWLFCHSFTDVLKEFQGVSVEVKAIVDRLSQLQASDESKFKFFVCECLNKRKDTLALWVEHVLGDKKRLLKYYQQDAYILHVLPETRRNIVRELCRISNLHFKLGLPDRIIQETIKSTEPIILME